MFYCIFISLVQYTYSCTHAHHHISMTTVLSSHTLWVKLMPVICWSQSFSHFSFFCSCLFCYFDKSIWLAMMTEINGSHKATIWTHTYTYYTHSCTLKLTLWKKHCKYKTRLYWSLKWVSLSLWCQSINLPFLGIKSIKIQLIELKRISLGKKIISVISPSTLC